MPPCNSCLVTEQSRAALGGSSRSRAFAFQFQCKQRAYAPSTKQSFLSFPVRTGFRLKRGLVLRPRLQRQYVLASAQGSDRNWEREEARWLREEQRWVRDEQRWLREEERWNTERKAWAHESSRMMEEIRSLRLEIENLQKHVPEEQSFSSLREILLGLKGLLQSLKAETADSNGAPLQMSGLNELVTREPSVITEQPVERVKFVLPSSAVFEDRANPEPEVSSSSSTGETKANQGQKNAQSAKQRTLKTGSGGDDVKALQEALAKLGFYCGEDDMEYSYFSTGTASAVRSWQASIGVPEDGTVTTQAFTELLNRQSIDLVSVNSTVTKSPVEKVEAASSVISQETLENSSTSNSESRVYLLGENRYEDPDRLLRRRSPQTTARAQKCFSCRGEGRALCTECEGTGELNVEEQFLEWAGEGAKCPYCEGSGTVVCDQCDGKGVEAV